jgi:hypothetical protein
LLTQSAISSSDKEIINACISLQKIFSKYQLSSYFMNWKILFNFLVISSTVLSLGGCTTVEPSMTSMAVHHNAAIDKIERDTLLLNILRAADDEPLTLTTLSYISGSGSVGASLGYSDSWSSFFAKIASASSNTSLNVNRGFSYSLGTLDSEQFSRSFLTDVPLDRLLYLSEGTHLDNAVLWTLVLQSVYLQGSGSNDGLKRKEQRNALEPKQWTAFQKVLTESLSYGLSMEEVPFDTPVGPRMSRNDAIYQINNVINSWNPQAWSPTMAGTAKPMLVEVGGKDPETTHQLVMRSNKINFCYSPAQLYDWRYDDQRLCTKNGVKAAWAEHLKNRGNTAESPKPVPHEWLDINVRSPREIFYFLGQIARPQIRTGAQSVTIGGVNVDSKTTPKPLFSVVCDSEYKSGEPLAQATHRGRSCHVPRDDHSYSAQVLQYLSLLITMSKVPGAVPSSPTVLIR